MTTYKCAVCDRAIKDAPLGEGWVHTDGRVRTHAPVLNVGAAIEEEQMSPRTRIVPPEGEPQTMLLGVDDDGQYEGFLDPDDPADASLIGEAERVFGDMLPEDYERGEVMEEVLEVIDDENPPTEEVPSGTSEVGGPQMPTFGRPTADDFITVRGGGLYLGARRRIVWMRGEPVPHPDWTIDTYPEEIERGTYVNNSKVSGGYARYRSNIFDETGRLISTGTKTEWSERFMDFAEKAETGAIARALAVAGYGTEAALDLDEGAEDGRIADAPVQGRPIHIGSSNATGLRQGGRSEHITSAQLNEISRLTKQLKMGVGIIPLVEGVLGVSVPELDPTNPSGTILTFLNGLTFEQASTLIQALNKASNEAT